MIGKFKQGLYFWLVIGILIYGINALYKIILWLPAPDIISSWWWARAIFLILIIFLTGVLFTSSLMKKFFSYISSKLPRFTLLKFLIPEDITQKKFPEVRLNINDSIRMYGLVVKEWSENGVELCHILVPSVPVPATGFLLTIEKDKLEFTGRDVKDLAITCLSFGTK